MSAVAATPARPGIDEGQRLTATTMLSLLVHGIVLLGVGFAVESAAPVVPTLDVILTRTTTELSPEQADFLAQASNQGGGEHDSSSRPSEPVSGPLPAATAGVAPRELRAQSPAPQPPPQARVVSSTRGDSATPAALETPPPDERPRPRGEEQISHDMAMARLAAEIHLRSERYAKRPKRKFVSASTTEYAWAGYLREWVDRVERVGNLNYPDEARRRRLGGQVVISVAIRRDGSVEDSAIVVSSGIPLLDASALRIARLAEPYPPLPRTGEDPDVLHVTRTWAFLPGGELVDR
ncbi:energy transducer TonB [Lysobacter arseniciresistens ZS79]|uniref:Energy transducer TonB n=1 Tax=Lysobacter arseniciresistens ZS79 TaxID=913325 RepID=A0A0A0F232_9GAMM|nr:energy transducer TonB [Lysobacter arseniciresistens]KGM56630.1 energy transducer TonB [Lysobacter arseniciresistens ZS79]